jgi:CMP-N-acetylneuraminic acid synthetase
MTIAIITLAREGSIRIKHKNMKLFLGKPLIQYTFDIMKQLEGNKYVITDYNEVKELAKKNNLNIIDEPEEHACNDYSPRKLMEFVHSVIKEDIVVMLPPTSPLRCIEDILNWIDIFKKGKYEAGCTIREIENKLYYMNNEPINFQQERRATDNFKTEKIYFETGSFYIFKRDQMIKNHLMTGKSIKFIDKYDINLDYDYDWKNAEVKYGN